MLAAVALTPPLLGTRAAEALDMLGAADARWLWAAGAGFALSVVAAAGSWRCAIGLCGGRLGLTDAAARYGAGSLVNTFVPGRAGDAVRLGLFSRALDHGDRIWRASGSFAALGAARIPILVALVVAGAAIGALPIWPVFVALALLTTVAGIGALARRTKARSRVAHILDAFRTLGREPLAGLRLVGWIGLALAGRIVAAAAIGASLGIGRPFAAALVIVPALELSGLLPLTPGNLGIAGGTVAIAFQAGGVSFANGLAAGIAFQAVETAVGIAFGLGSVLWLAPYPSPGVRRVALLAAGASASLAVAGALGATVLVPLV